MVQRVQLQRIQIERSDGALESTTERTRKNQERDLMQGDGLIPLCPDLQLVQEYSFAARASAKVPGNILSIDEKRHIIQRTSDKWTLHRVLCCNLTDDAYS